MFPSPQGDSFFIQWNTLHQMKKNKHKVSVPSRGFFFYSNTILHNGHLTRRYCFRPLKGILFLFECRYHMANRTYVCCRFPSPQGDSFFIHDYIQVYYCVNDTLRFRPLKGILFLFPIQWYTWRGMEWLLVSVPSRGFFFYSLNNLAPVANVSALTRFRPLKGILFLFFLNSLIFLKAY